MGTGFSFAVAAVAPSRLRLRVRVAAARPAARLARLGVVRVGHLRVRPVPGELRQPPTWAQDMHVCSRGGGSSTVFSDLPDFVSMGHDAAGSSDAARAAAIGSETMVVASTTQWPTSAAI